MKTTRIQMMTPTCVGVWVMAVCMLLSLDAFAVGFEFKVKHKKSQTDGAMPVLVLEAADIIKKGTVTLKSKTAGSSRVRLKRMNPGAVKSIALNVKPGKHTFEVHIEAYGLSDEKATIPLKFEVVRVPPIKIKIDKEAVDTGAGMIPIESNRPVDRIEMKLRTETSHKVFEHQQNFGGKSGKLTFTWPKKEKVSAIQLQVYDVDGFWTSVLLEPWFIEIDHEEIVFETGKASWKDEETPKLKKSLAQVKKVMKRHAKHRPDMRLYVAGHTDTVGASSKNQRLSQARARAIAAWFRKNGVNIPVFYQGFGESALAIKTPDNTDEVRNRRAVYVLANAPPPKSFLFPKRSWSRSK